MTQPDQFRDDVYSGEGYRQVPQHNDLSARLEAARALDGEPMARELDRGDMRQMNGRDSGQPVGRMSGTPLPGNPLPGNPLPGNSASAPDASAQRAVPPGRALSVPSAQAVDDPTAMQRAMGILKQAAPFVARLLPLLDGSLGAAISNLLSPQHAAQAVSVDLAPLKNQLAEMQAHHTELQGTLQDHTTGLKRVEDQLDLVREATDRNTLEQQELMGDLKSVARKVNMVALGVSILLVASIVINVILYLYVKRVLP